MRIRLFLITLTLAALSAQRASAASLPAPGSAYHLLFATSNTFRTTTTQSIPPPTGRFGLIAAADWQTTSLAFDAQLPGATDGQWDGVSTIYRAILSISGDNARDRLNVAGPVYNLHGDELATGHADLFDGSIAAPVAYDEFGNLITTNPDVWTGCTSDGTATAQTCGSWDNVSSSASARVGNVLAAGAPWLSTGLSRACNLGARLYGLSPALTAPLWGDYDCSGKVDGRDFLEWQRSVGLYPSPTFAAARSFLDGNLTQPVGMADLAVWQEHYGQSLPVAVVSVPEPGTFALLLITTSILSLPWRDSLLEC